MAGESYAIPPKIVLLRGFFGISSTINLPAVIACRPSACCAKRLAFRVRRCVPVSRDSSRAERSKPSRIRYVCVSSQTQYLSGNV